MEKVFLPINIKRGKYPETLNCSFKKDRLIQFINEQPGEWVSFTIKLKRNPDDKSSHYAELYVPKPKESNEQPEKGSNNNLPF